MEREFNELGIKLINKKSTLSETKALKKEQILELKNSINEVTNASESTGNKANHIKERNSKLQEMKKIYENYLTPLGQHKDNGYPRKIEGKGNRESI